VNPVEVREAYEAVLTEAGPGVTVVAATKYVSAEEMGALADAGVAVVGENRAQDMQRKHELYGDRFRWHFIGALQSNKARVANELCELVHAVDTDSTARRLTVPWLLGLDPCAATARHPSSSGASHASDHPALSRAHG